MEMAQGVRGESLKGRKDQEGSGLRMVVNSAPEVSDSGRE